jgi:hypothetical protein
MAWKSDVAPCNHLECLGCSRSVICCACPLPCSDSGSGCLEDKMAAMRGQWRVSGPKGGLCCACVCFVGFLCGGGHSIDLLCAGALWGDPNRPQDASCCYQWAVVMEQKPWDLSGHQNGLTILATPFSQLLRRAWTSRIHSCIDPLWHKSISAF